MFFYTISYIVFLKYIRTQAEIQGGEAKGTRDPLFKKHTLNISYRYNKRQISTHRYTPPSKIISGSAPVRARLLK